MTVFYKKTVQFLAFIVCQVVWINTAQAQQRSTVTLQSIIDSAQNHLPVLLQKRALINSANAAVGDAYDSHLPSVKVLDELSAGSSNSTAGVYFPMSIVPSVSGSIRNSNDLDPEGGNIGMLYGQYDLIDFGLSKAKVGLAKSYLGLVKSDFDKEVYLLKWQSATTYFDLLKNQYQLGIDRQNINRYKDIYRVIQTLTINGIRPGVDSSQLIAELSTTRINYNNTEGTINELEQQLNYYTGIPTSQMFIDTSISTLNIPSPILYDSGLNVSNNPFMSYFHRQTDYYKSNQLLIKKSYQPKIELLGGLWGRGSSIQYDDQYKGMASGLGYQRFNYAAAVSFVYDLFDPVHRRDKMSENKFRISASENEYNQEAEDLENNLQKANNVISTIDQNLKEMPLQMQAAEDAYNQRLAQYNAGIINLIDLTNASFVLYRAQSDYVQLLDDWYNANLNKAAITGNLDQFIQSIKK